MEFKRVVLVWVIRFHRWFILVALLQLEIATHIEGRIICNIDNILHWSVNNIVLSSFILIFNINLNQITLPFYYKSWIDLGDRFKNHLGGIQSSDVNTSDSVLRRNSHLWTRSDLKAICESSEKLYPIEVCLYEY